MRKWQNKKVFFYMPYFLLLLTPAAQAMTFKDLWWRPDQQGYALLTQGAPAQAAQQFQDPMWRGVADYRAGDFNAALKEFAKFNTEQGNYNRGNTLAQMGQYEQAIAAYDQALQQNPNDADAKHNRELIQQLLKQKQQQPQQQPQSNQNQNKNSPQDQNKDQAGAQNQQQNPNQQQSQNQNQPQPQSQQNQQTAQNDQQQPQQQDQQQQNQHQPQQDKSQQNNQQQQPQDNQSQNKNSANSNQQQAQAKAENQTAPPAHYDQKQQAMQQWLQSIPDDPGGLLKQKFLRDHQRLLASENEDNS